ncbi:MAG TPA: uroporphyrinogen decarboxylase family protein [Bacteroidota bacterium]|nr:uroporphyrinogen decarboxylase family protein [Bacteroidota bacterium]
MTSRERVLASLHHSEPDRVPIDLSGHRSSGIAALLYPKLRQFLGLPPRPVRVYDQIQQLAIVDDDVLERFGIDTIELGRGFALEDEHWVDWVLPDGTPCEFPAWMPPERQDKRWVIRSKTGHVIAQMPDGAIYFEQTCFPFFEKDDLDAIQAAMAEAMWTAIASPPGPLVEGPQGDQFYRQQARRFRKGTDRAILGLFGGNLLEMGQFLYRNDGFLLLLAEDPDRAHAFLDRIVEMHLKNLEHFLGVVGESIDIIVFGDDLGMQSGPQISPAMYREFFKPRHKIMWERAKQLAPVNVMLHCCGGVRELLPDLIDAGLDAINPVQIACSGMDVATLKSEFGSEMVFWGGGCDTQRILPQGTPEEIAAHVRHQVDILKRGGGFVFQQVHNILADVPPENVVAMLDAVNGTD